MKPEEVWGVIRTILAAGGGWVAGTGWVDAATYQSLLGAAGVIFVGVWSIIAKRKTAAAKP